jgi:hypothetical protein
MEKRHDPCQQRFTRQQSIAAPSSRTLPSKDLGRSASQKKNRAVREREAGWLTTLIEEFYILLDGPDPRGSRLYSLLYHRFEALRAVPMPAPLPQEGSGAVQDMSKNLQGYFDEDS